jgi:DNA repair protein RadA/Sms
MAKLKSRWVCQECGFQTFRSLGRCTECGNWNSFVEEIFEDESAKKGFAARLSAMPDPALNGRTAETSVPLDQIESTSLESKEFRLDTGSPGLDEVLGGGLVPGSVLLLAGDPGIGKSTLLLQVAQTIAQTNKRVLYVSGEESAAQVRLRANRLGISHGNILVTSAQDVSAIRESMLGTDLAVAIVDSIQAVYHPQIASAPGSVSQVRESANLIVNVAKDKNIATILVGHVTKEGSIAGPRVLEHMVDVVLHFEGDRARQLRILKAAKNRFGSTQEIAIYSMTERGLFEVDNPSATLLGDRLNKMGHGQAPSGTAVIAGGEGSKTLLLEVQALVGSTAYPGPRRVANGFDYNRLLQIIAVLEKKVGLDLSHHDVYINIVGGLDFSDPSGDLGIAIAIATSLLDRSIDPALLCIGEIGLTGEVRPVVSLSQRLKESARLGFKKALVPASNLPLESKPEQIQLIGVEFLADALTKILPDFQPVPGKTVSFASSGEFQARARQTRTPLTDL